MSKKVTYKKNLMTYTKGMTRQEVMDVITKRMEKRQKELDKRKWIVDEYHSLEKRQEEDKSWLMWCQRQTDEKW